MLKIKESVNLKELEKFGFKLGEFDIYERTKRVENFKYGPISIITNIDKDTRTILNMVMTQTTQWIDYELGLEDIKDLIES